MHSRDSQNYMRRRRAVFAFRYLPHPKRIVSGFDEFLLNANQSGENGEGSSWFIGRPTSVPYAAHLSSRFTEQERPVSPFS